MNAVQTDPQSGGAGGAGDHEHSHNPHLGSRYHKAGIDG